MDGVERVRVTVLSNFVRNERRRRTNAKHGSKGQPLYIYIKKRAIFPFVHSLGPFTSSIK